MGLVIDTSVFIEAERSFGITPAFPPRVASFLQTESLFGVSAITLSEIAFGYARNHRLSENQKSALLQDLRIVCPVFEVTAEVALRSGALNAHLRQNGTPIGLADILIAATALELGFGVLTHNTRHFSYVPDLRILDAADF